MKKMFTKPVLTVCRFDSEDVVRTSNTQAYSAMTSGETKVKENNITVVTEKLEFLF